MVAEDGKTNELLRFKNFLNMFAINGDTSTRMVNNEHWVKMGDHSYIITVDAAKRVMEATTRADCLAKLKHGRPWQGELPN
jgi:hypothetical protein